MKNILLPLSLGTCLLLASCGKKPADNAAPEPTTTPETTTVAPQPAAQATTQPETATPDTKPEPYPGLEIPNPPPPPKHSQLSREKAVWGVMHKTLPEVVEFLGTPSSKKEYWRQFYPDGWLYEWD